MAWNDSPCALTLFHYHTLQFPLLMVLSLHFPARELQKITTIPTEEQWKGVGLQMPRGLKGYTKTKQTAAPAEAAAEEAPKEKIIVRS